MSVDCRCLIWSCFGESVGTVALLVVVLQYHLVVNNHLRMPEPIQGGRVGADGTQVPVSD